MAERLTIPEVAEKTNKAYGPGTMFEGTGLKKDPPRIPFGVFSLDFATGGGIPVSGSCGLWGPEAGGKSSLAANALASAQLLCWRCFKYSNFCECSRSPLQMQGVWLDIEGTLDRAWLHSIGADPEKYHVVLADYGEQYANIADNVLKADECGLLIVDSLAALVPEAERKAAAEDDFYALQARLIGRMVRNLRQRIITERRRGHPVSIVYINQMRTKIGVTFGSPEWMPGGWALRHEMSLFLRVVKKALNENDKAKYSTKDRDRAVRHSFSIKKEKVLTLAGVGEFVRLREPMPDMGLEAGQIADHATVLNYAKEHGVVEKSKSKKTPWRFGKINARTLEQIKSLWTKRPEYYLKAKSDIVESAKARLKGEE